MSNPLKSFLLIFISSLPGAFGQSANQRAAAMIEPMEAVLRRYNDMGSFLRDEAGVDAYVDGLERSGMLPHRLRGQRWVRTHIHDIARQMRWTMSGFTAEQQQEAWRYRSPDFLLVEESDSAEPVPTQAVWNDRGAELWGERFAEIIARLGTERLGAGTDIQTFSAIFAQELGHWRTHRWRGNPMLTQVVTLMLRGILTEERQFEFFPVDSPEQVSDAFRMVSNDWAEQISQLLLVSSPTLGRRQLGQLTGLLMKDAQAAIGWPDAAMWSTWTRLEPRRVRFVAVGEMPRLIHTILVTGVIGTECTSGGRQRHRDWIHPHDYLIPMSPGARSMMAIRWELSRETEYRGTVVLVPFEHGPHELPLFALRSRLVPDRFSRTGPIVYTAMEIARARRIVTQGDDRNLDNSGFSTAAQKAIPEAEPVLGHYQLPEAFRFRTGIEAFFPEGDLAFSRPLLARPIAPGVTASNLYTLQIDFESLNPHRPRNYDPVARVHAWIGRLRASIEASASIQSADLGMRLLRLADRFPSERLGLVEVVALLVRRDPELRGFLESRTVQSHMIRNPLWAEVGLLELLSRVPDARSPSMIYPIFDSLRNSMLGGTRAWLQPTVMRHMADWILTHPSPLVRARAVDYVNLFVRDRAPSAAPVVDAELSTLLAIRFAQGVGSSPNGTEAPWIRMADDLDDPALQRTSLTSPRSWRSAYAVVNLCFVSFRAIRCRSPSGRRTARSGPRFCVRIQLLRVAP